METYFLSCKCTLARSLLRAPQITNACFTRATCVMTTTHGVQSSFFEEILKPTMSLLPAADWLLSSKYLLLLFTYCALDDGSDYSWRCHRSCARLIHLSRSHMLPRLTEDPDQTNQVRASVLPTLLP